MASDVHASRIVSHDIESTAIAKNAVGIKSLRNILVYLPDGYEDGKHRYPVIYWIPGWGSGAGAGGGTYQKVLDNAIQSGKITPVIVVSVDVHEGILCLNSPIVGNWEDFMVSELVPFIDKTYPTIPDPNARGLAGHSAGGYTALMLPLLHPNIWGSVGGNDPALWITNMYASVSPPFPQNLNEYASATLYNKILLQLASSFSPNPDSPILCDLPVTPNGVRLPEVLEKLGNYDLMIPNTLDHYTETLKNFLSITIVVPEIMDGTTNSSWNIGFINYLQSAGITTTRLDMPGAHASFMPERFIAIAEELLKAMQGSGTSVSPKGKASTLWGEIRR
ncbi:TPA: hypothetical protein ENS27_04055 [bacterium]|nr:hypothetical protein [bacterium]